MCCYHETEALRLMRNIAGKFMHYFFIVYYYLCIILLQANYFFHIFFLVMQILLFQILCGKLFIFFYTTQHTNQLIKAHLPFNHFLEAYHAICCAVLCLIIYFTTLIFLLSKYHTLHWQVGSITDQSIVCLKRPNLKGLIHFLKRCASHECHIAS